MANDRTFISPKGKDNQTRLSAVTALALIDAMHVLEQALINGERMGTGFTAGAYSQAQAKLVEAFEASTMLSASLQVIKSDEDYETAEAQIKSKFADINRMLKEGIL